MVGLKKGVGFAKAAKLLEGFELPFQNQRILRLFIEEYGEYDGIVNFAKNYQLLKILREKEGFEIPEFQKVISPTKEEIKIDF